MAAGPARARVSRTEGGAASAAPEASERAAAAEREVWTDPKERSLYLSQLPYEATKDKISSFFQVNPNPQPEPYP